VLLKHISFDDDPNYAICKSAKEVLEGSKDAKGRKLEVIDLPLRLEVLHMHSYSPNVGIRVPTAGDTRHDDAALAILREVFPERKVVGVCGCWFTAAAGPTASLS
jgi:agmatine deiminase